MKVSIEEFDWAALTPVQRGAVLSRPVAGNDETLRSSVCDILRLVRTQDDTALFDLIERHDRAHINKQNLFVLRDEFDVAMTVLDPRLRAAIELSIVQVRTFHSAQRSSALRMETIPGVICGRRSVAIDSVGLYVPGGSAPLLSTLIMLAAPALEAGCRSITIATPPQKDGSVHPAILATARLLGVQRIAKMGGAQAIAALAYGTESVSRVDKIFGPGNAWVTEAKMQVAFDPAGAAIDMPAGPSEVMVVADAEANPAFVASDLLAQAEHDRNSQVILVATDRSLIAAVQAELQTQLSTLERREIATAALAQSRAIFVADVGQAMEIANTYAPEHLILQTRKAGAAAEMVRNAGSIFIGPWSPESAGDYASGPNHVLPTYGFARAFGGLGLESFMKTITWQELTPQGLGALGPAVELMARAEGLGGHARAVTLRLAALAQAAETSR